MKWNNPKTERWLVGTAISIIMLCYFLQAALTTYKEVTKQEASITFSCPAHPDTCTKAELSTWEARVPRKGEIVRLPIRGECHDFRVLKVRWEFPGDRPANVHIDLEKL